MKKSDTRSQIELVALRIFAQEGEDGITMRRIASELGVTATTIYRHFKDKDELINVIVEHGFSMLEKKLNQARQSESGLDAIFALSDAYIEFAINSPNFFDLMFLKRRVDVRKIPDDLKEGKSSSFNQQLEVVIELIEEKQLKVDDPFEVALALWSQAHGLAALFHCGRFGDSQTSLSEIAHRSVQRLINGLKQ